MNLLDAAFILVVLLSVIAGFREGFARSSVGFAAAIVGVCAGFWYAADVGSQLMRFTTSHLLANFFGFVIVFGACVLVGGIIGILLSTMFKWVGLSWLDRVVGGLFGFARGLVVAVALLTVYLACAPNPPPRVITHSRVAPYLMDASAVMATVIPTHMRDTFRTTTSRVRKIWSERLNSEGPRSQDEEAAHL